MKKRLPRFRSDTEEKKNHRLKFLRKFYENSMAGTKELREATAMHLAKCGRELAELAAGRKMLEKHPDFMIDLIKAMSGLIA